MFNSIRTSFFLAYRYLFRRNLVTSIVMIGLLIVVLYNTILPLSLLNGLVGSFDDQIIDYSTAHIVISPKGNTDLKNNTDLYNYLDSNNKIKEYVYREQFVAQIKHGDEQIGSTITSINPDLDDKVFNFDETIKDGKWLENDETGVVVMGIQTAGQGKEDLVFYNNSLKSADIGDTVTITNNRGVSKELKIKGIYESRLILADTQVFITDSELASFGSMRTNQRINILLSDFDDVDEVIEDIERNFDNLTIDSWAKSAGLLEVVADSLNEIKRIIYLAGVVLSALIVFIINYIRINNQQKQIGLAKALGIGNKTMVLNYLVMNLTYFAIAAIIALTIFYFIVQPYSRANPLLFPVGFVSMDLDPQELYTNIGIIVITIILSSITSVSLLIRKPITKLIWG